MKYIVNRGKTGSSKKKFFFGNEDREVDKDYTIDELLESNANVVSGSSRLLEGFE